MRECLPVFASSQGDPRPGTLADASRRRFIATLGAFAAGGWVDPAALVAATPWLAFRPAAFDVGADSATIWMCTDEAATVRVRYAEGDGWSESKLSSPVALSADSGFTGAVRIEGLKPGTRYRYRITDADGRARDADFATGAFATAPDAHRDFTFAFSADTHARHKPFRICDLIVERKPDFFIHLGDTAYADSPRSQFSPTLAHYRTKHREVRADAHLQRLLATTPTFAIWDDHEVENDFIGSHPAMPIGRQAFVEFWPRGAAAGASGTADRRDERSILYRKFAWTPACEFFIVDTRQYRDAGDAGAGHGRTLLGATQLEWLKDALKASRATFRFICSSVPFHHNGIDKWGGFKAERRALVDFIREQRIRNVIVLSADLHAAADLSDTRSGLAEFLVGPLAAPLQSQTSPNSRLRDLSRPGSYVADECNFGLIRVAQRDGRTILAHQVIDARNQMRYSREVVAEPDR